MSLRSETKRVLKIAMGDNSKAQEISDAIDGLTLAIKALTAKLDDDTGVADNDYSDITESL